MTLSEFKNTLTTALDSNLKFMLPDGDVIEAHAHITEVGRVDKTFIDCGGKIWKKSTCLLQVWVADDLDHRLHADKLATVLDRASVILENDDLEMEIEYEDCSITQFAVTSAKLESGMLTFTLGEKHTDCLAKDVCLPNNANSCC